MDMTIPSLPLEIWTRILGHVSEPHYLPRTWLNCRRVSHAFKAATETAFTDVYLRRMVIRTELAEIIDLTFAGFAENDRSVVCFAHAPADRRDAPPRMPPELMARLEQQAERAWTREHQRYLSSIENGSPSLLYQIWLMGHVEDTGFPGLKMDISSRSMWFEWKTLLSTMFGEIEYRKWLLRKEIEASLGEGNEESWGESPPQDAISRVANIEMHVRKLRPWNAASKPGRDRRQEWQVNSLQAYRPDLGVWWREEENWGVVYDEVHPRYPQRPPET
ncbi:hypothetical protein PFICI_04033 [Pestalotiopsis fici W106-1]|uniref:Uncharacterized protein n=1 Tax=Pestalotiopsis fici (strain W106-1 / CGMCC3.15140) TaxID=1229662 RepID=W3XIW3_PESFW|nr:uncharacterized protein PFICI_04033 [Pestalotiopsis fici W106-1]ETS86008.1 hypothetical protein PFICI_04033 [Pestalotiopsis fici W106-1]